MLKSDEENLILAESIDSVDAINARFYGRFTYPWRPKRFEQVLDPNFETIRPIQNLGGRLRHESGSLHRVAISKLQRARLRRLRQIFGAVLRQRKRDESL